MFTFNVGYEKSRQLDKMHLYFKGDTRRNIATR